jgi:hypothetical protein
MALTMRPTGLGSGIDKDRQDYTFTPEGGTSAASMRCEAATRSRAKVGMSWPSALAVAVLMRPPKEGPPDLGASELALVPRSPTTLEG